MARSIHETKRRLEEEHRWEYADEGARAAALERLREASARKRCIKGAVAAQRAAPAGDGRSDILSIPIGVEDAGPYLHYPASPDDIRAVMRHLPGGALDGLRSIDLCLGADRQGDAGGDGDPYTARAGWEGPSGIFLPGVLGVYSSESARIQVFGAVYRPDLPDRPMWEVYLRLRMLCTFVHEAAHHFDHAARVARGRWLAEDEEKAELYAEDREFAWVGECVVPYVEAAYGGPLETLLAWVERHGGVRMIAERIAEDPRQHAKGGLVRSAAIFTVGGALERLASDVLAGEDARSTRLGFARRLHYAELYAEALESIDGVLEDHPNDAEALALQADIYGHLDRNEEAAALARKALEIEPDNLYAWEALADALNGLEQWAEMLDAMDRAQSLSEEPDWLSIRQRARGLLALNRFEELERGLDALSRQPGKLFQRWAAEIREAMEARMAEARDINASS